jgi:flagellar biosynthetic protein FlhB
MADQGFQDKTEQATPRKKEQAREKGQVARNKDITSMAVMGGILMIFYLGGESFINNLSEMTGEILSMQHGNNPLHVSRVAIIRGVQIITPFFLMSVVLATLSTVAQGGFVYKPLKIELSKLSPNEGLKKIFSMKGITEFIKSLLKFLAGGWVVYFILRKDLDVLPMLTAMEVHELIRVSGKLIMEAFTIAFLLFLAVAFVSYALEKWQFERSLRMTKQEVKDESKESEGDPLVKSRIKSLQREMARKRMMQEVPTATVVITNPTHLAIAIKYEDKEMFAPRIVAKGAGVVAEKIREIARKHNVPIVEDKPLARSLFKLELNSFVPESLYIAVAKILAYIYKLKGKA